MGFVKSAPVAPLAGVRMLAGATCANAFAGRVTSTPDRQTGSTNTLDTRSNTGRTLRVFGPWAFERSCSQDAFQKRVGEIAGLIRAGEPTNGSGAEVIGRQ